jgi:hypothetical protein
MPCVEVKQLTSNLDGSEIPKSSEYHQRTGYLRGQEFEDLRAFRSLLEWDQINDCSVITCKHSS